MNLRFVPWPTKKAAIVFYNKLPTWLLGLLEKVLIAAAIRWYFGR